MTSPARLRRRTALRWAVVLGVTWGAGLLSGCGANAIDGFACETTPDCAALDDGDLCNGTLVCEQGRCQPGPVVVCDTSGDAPCQRTACEPSTGACVQADAAEGAPCDDGAPCTPNDRCKAGACVPGAVNVCSCETTADCADDGDLCNGTPVCDTSAFPYVCVVNPATVVTCKTDGTPCRVASCTPATGVCAQTNAPDGAPCDDGDACSSGEACAAGACVGGTGTCGCKADRDCPDPDSDPCTGVPYCDLSTGIGICKANPASVVVCSTLSDTLCRKNTCNPADGACALEAVAEGKACDDGDACTQGEVCSKGACGGGTSVCSCTKDSDCSDDGDLCNGLPFCDQTSGTCAVNPATVVTCASQGDTACAKNVCVPQSGACAVLPRANVKVVGCATAPDTGAVTCVWTPTAATQTGTFACDDGNACTVGDACVGSACVAGTAVCQCAQDADCDALDDGDLCNGSLYCDKAVGKCVLNPASVVACDPSQDNDCQTATCVPATGGCVLKAAAKGAPCDDGDDCTLGDSCDGGGACGSGPPKPCTDQDPCTVDACKPGLGCVFTAKNCTDGNVCTEDTCDAKTGVCTNPAASKGAPCNADSDGCTVADACDGQGGCVAGGDAPCSSANPCQQGVCSSKGPSAFVCKTVHVADGAPCPDDDPCLVGSTCQGGSCKPGTKSSLFHFAPQAPGKMVFQGGALVSEGATRAVLAGAVQSGPRTGEWWVVGINAAGEQDWLVTVAAPSGLKQLGDVAAVLPLGSLGTLVAGTGWLPNLQPVPVTVHISPEGKSAAPLQHKLTGTTLTQEVQGAALHPSGNVLLVGRASPKQPLVRASISTLTGAVSGSHIISDVSPGRVHVTPRKDGTVLVGIEGEGQSDAGTIVFWKPGSGPLYQLHTGPNESNVTLPVLVSAPSGQAYTVLRVTSAGVEEVRWFRIDANDALTSRIVPGPPASFATHMAWSPTHMAQAGVSAKGVAWVGRRDTFGNEHWRRDVAGGPAQLHGLATLGGRVMLFGGDAAGASPRASLVSRWGDSSCTTLGACASKTLADCVDKASCTVDACDAKTGCVHTVKKSNVCDPQLPCTDSGSCETGSCKPAEEGRTFTAMEPLTAATHLAAVGVDTQGTVYQWFVGNAPLDGGQWKAWPRELLLDARSFISYPPTTTPSTLGKTAMAGSPHSSHAALDTVPSGAVTVARLRQFGSVTQQPTPQTADVILKDPACPSCKVTGIDLVKSPDGTFLAAAHSDGGGGRVLVSRHDAKGGTAWQSVVDARPTEARRLVARHDGAPQWAGRVQLKQGWRPAVGWTTPFGKTGATLVDVASGDGALEDVVTHADLSLVAVGANASVGAPGGAQSLIAAWSAKGKLTWRKAGSDHARFFSAAALPSGGVVVTGSVVQGGMSRLLVRRYQSDGALLWARAHGTPSKSPLPVDASLVGSDVLRLSDGALLLVGTFSAKVGPATITGSLAAYADASGHISCAAAGACAALEWAACDDANPCTADWCDPTKGCTHSALPGGPCGASGTCSQGSCQP